MTPRHGTVTWFDDRKGFGFLRDAAAHPGDPAADVFVHYADIRREGFKTLAPGETVTYELKPGESRKAALVTPQQGR